MPFIASLIMSEMSRGPLSWNSRPCYPPRVARADRRGAGEREKRGRGRVVVIRMRSLASGGAEKAPEAQPCSEVPAALCEGGAP